MIRAWSFSRWRDYERCPLRAKLKHVVGLKEPEPEAFKRGSEAHAIATAYLNKKRGVIPKELRLMLDNFKQLRKHTLVYTEKRLAFAKDWTPLQDFFAKTTWVRIIMDAIGITGTAALIVDFKTGKVNADFEEQLELYAIGALCAWPDLDYVTPELWYLDHGVVQPIPRRVYKRAELPVLKTKWEARTTAMLSDKQFAPRPGNHCRWCHFRRENNGPCQY